MEPNQEYEICADNIRHYDTIFFAHITLFVASMARFPRSSRQVLRHRVGCLQRESGQDVLSPPCSG